MHAVSDEYLEMIAGDDRHFSIRCKFDGIDDYITFEHILSGSYTNIVDGNNIISMGNACPNKMELTISDFEQAYVWKGARFTVEFGLYVAGAYEWLPWGTFWVTEMSTSNHRRTIHLTAYDYMYKLSKIPYKTALTGPFHYCDLLNEFLTNTGMTLSTTAEMPTADDADYTILSWPEKTEFSYADIAGHLAGIAGCNAQISPSDASILEFKWYTPTGTKIKNTLYSDGFERLADSVLRVDYLVTGANNEIVVENTDEIPDGELDFRPFDSEDPADYPWLTFTYDNTNLTASVRLTEGYESETAGIGIPYALYYEGNIYNVTEVETSGFEGCLANAIVLPDTMTTIGEYAFQSCAGLTELTIPANVTSIGYGVTDRCTRLTTLYYNAVNATAGSSGGIFNNPALKTVIVGTGVTTIPTGLLRGASGVTYVYLPNTVTKINSHAFRACAALESCTIPKSVTVLGASLFNECDSLKTIYYNAVNATYSSTSSVIGSGALQTLEFGLGVQTIPQYLCRGCEGLKNVNFGGTVTKINTGAFYGCEGLTSITLPASVTTIASTAFKNCDNITSITIHKAADSISGSPWGAENATVSWVG